jgi:hypothetical protein
MDEVAAHLGRVQVSYRVPGMSQGKLGRKGELGVKVNEQSGFAKRVMTCVQVIGPVAGEEG